MVSKLPVRLLPAVVAYLSFHALLGQSAPATGGRPSLSAALAQLEVPPPWMEATRVYYDTGQPWRLARREIRRLLGLEDLDFLREAMKLTYLYREKKDIGDGHEYPMYLYLGGELAWAVRAHEAFLKRLMAEGKPGYAHTALDLASCYRHFGEYDKAIAVVESTFERRPKPPWDVPHMAHAHDMLGDLHAAKGDADQARTHYGKSAELRGQSRQPWGREKLPTMAAKSRAKAKMVGLPTFDRLGLADGTYQGASVGHVGKVSVTVQIDGGRVTDVALEHQENITLGSDRVTPRRIVDGQTLNVDAVTGATKTVDAIRHACYEALCKAGLTVPPSPGATAPAAE